MNRQQQRQIMRDDAKRRNAREIEEYLLLYHPSIAAGIDPYLVSRGITGEPSTINRVVRVGGARTQRAGRGSWADVSIRDNHRPPETLRQLATVGCALDSEGFAVLSADGSATVKVTRDGETSFVPVSSFRKETAGRSKTPPQAKLRSPEQEASLDRAAALRQARIDAQGDARDIAAMADGSA